MPTRTKPTPAEAVRILAVDDVEENLVALDAALDLEGVELVTAKSGFQALELMLNEDFALALLDVQMPEMDGFELAELMRGTERTRNIPIIFLTAVATDERRKFRGFEAGAVDYLLKPIDIQILKSKIAVFVELARQRQELARQRDELGAALGRLRAHGDNSPLAVIELDTDLRIVTWAEGARRLFGYEPADILGHRIEDAPFLLPGDLPDFLAAMRELSSGESRREMQEHRFLRANGEERDGEWYCSSLAGKGIHARTIMLQVLDVTERHRAQETQRLLIGELNHRVKNSLATVQAIASQSLRRAESLSQFAETFSGRLQSLAAAHSLLSATTWESASLRGLIADQLSIGSVAEDRLILEGTDIELPPELALRFALVLHELTTNAHKHGALANENGVIRITWKAEGGMLTFNWIESGGPRVSPPRSRGFGSELIENSLLPSSGTAEAEYLPEGIRWKIGLPIGDDEADNSLAGEEARPETPESGPAETTIGGLRVLIVEDEPLVAMELAVHLEEEGAVPLGPATSCRHALEIIDEQMPDAVLLDGNLNGEKVHEVADALASSGTPFAFVSGYGRDHLPERYRNRPAIGKPFSPAELMAITRELSAEAASGTRQKLTRKASA